MEVESYSLSFCVWLISPSVGLSRRIHTVACVRISFEWLTSVPLCGRTTWAHLFVHHGHLGRFPLLAPVKNTLLCTFVCVLGECPLSPGFGSVPGRIQEDFWARSTCAELSKELPCTPDVPPVQQHSTGPDERPLLGRKHG